MMNLEQKLEKFVSQHELIKRDQSVLLAVSGGIDSMVMLELFLRIRKRMKLQLSVVHVNHRLRGEESAGDERFVQEISESLGIPYYAVQVDVKSFARKHRLSVQAAARQLRYDQIEQIRQQIKADCVATAHHADDNAETVLLNILRGTGLHGLAGIPLMRRTGHIIRPLLFATRKEILIYAAACKVKNRDDSSNRLLKYKRNYLRHRIIPVLLKQTPDMVRKLNRIARLTSGINEKLGIVVGRSLNSIVQTEGNGCSVLDVKGFKDRPEFLRDEILITVLNSMEIEPVEKKIKALNRLCDLPTGRKVELSGRYTAYKDRQRIVFMCTHGNLSDPRLVKQGESYEYNGCRISIGKPEPVPAVYGKDRSSEYVDAGRLSQSLVLRAWHPGDWFIPLGMRKKKKVSDFFADQKIPLFKKASVPILESDGSIVWICGKRLDDRFKLTEHTDKAVRISCYPLI